MISVQLYTDPPLFLTFLSHGLSHLAQQHQSLISKGPNLNSRPALPLHRCVTHSGSRLYKMAHRSIVMSRTSLGEETNRALSSYLDSFEKETTHEILADASSSGYYASTKSKGASPGTAKHSWHFLNHINFHEPAGQGWYRVYFALPSLCGTPPTIVGKLWHVMVEREPLNLLTSRQEIRIRFLDMFTEMPPVYFGQSEELRLSDLPPGGASPSDLEVMIGSHSTLLRLRHRLRPIRRG
jgi:hypothetical protein